MLWWFACTPEVPTPPASPVPEPTEQPVPAVPVEPPLLDPPAGWVRLTDHLPGLPIDIRYATEDNFTGAPLPGYEAADAWLTLEAADALADVRRAVQAEGLDLLVYDAYRPVRASQAMVDWTERVGRQDLLTDGYIAARSGHNRGATVDLTLVDPSGRPLDMGTPWDHFGEASHTERATGQALENRKRLRERMMAAGFRPYRREWWHFSLPAAAAEPLDLPYRRRYLPEGATSR